MPNGPVNDGEEKSQDLRWLRFIMVPSFGSYYTSKSRSTTCLFAERLARFCWNVRSEMQRHRNYSTFLLHSTRVDRKSNSMSLEIVSHERKKCPTIELLQFEKVVIRTWPQWHFENNWLFRNKLFWNDRWMYFILTEYYTWLMCGVFRYNIWISLRV